MLDFPFTHSQRRDRAVLQKGETIHRTPPSLSPDVNHDERIRLSNTETDTITINVVGKKSISLVCSKCGCARNIIVSSLPDIGRVYKVKCKCIHGFSISFEKRKYKRKTTKLIGTYAFQHSMTNNIIDIINLSRGGLGFVRTDRNKMKKGDILIVRFNLNNSEHDMIECLITIRHIFDNHVCGEFIDISGRMKQTLGFYLW